MQKSSENPNVKQQKIKKEGGGLIMESSLGIQSNWVRKLKPALFGKTVSLGDPPEKKKKKKKRYF